MVDRLPGKTNQKLIIKYTYSLGPRRRQYTQGPQELQVSNASQRQGFSDTLNATIARELNGASYGELRSS